jgi:hypothetical protein
VLQATPTPTTATTATTSVSGNCGFVACLWHAVTGNFPTASPKT